MAAAAAAAVAHEESPLEATEDGVDGRGTAAEDAQGVDTTTAAATAAAATATAGTTAAELRRAFADGWEATLRTCVNAVVSIRVNLVRSFDTERATSMQVRPRWAPRHPPPFHVAHYTVPNGQATGFVVDAARGIILTNRHVVTPGPIIAEAVFNNHEEVPVWPIYRDPVHDFGLVLPRAMRPVVTHAF